MSNYEEFVASKRIAAGSNGIDGDIDLHRDLFEFQADIVRWALRRGRAAIWADCGLGKSWMALEWARIVYESSPNDANVLILTPLAVAQQFVREGAKLGIEVTHCREQKDMRVGINVANYEKLHKFDTAALTGIVADESSILKDYTSSTRNALIEAFARTPYRLACTATPSPNDIMELGNHAEFLGVMSRTEMLAMFFTHDGGDTSKWRLKGHAQKAFWKWVCSWAVNVRKPSDLGYPDDGFALPTLSMRETVVKLGGDYAASKGELFVSEAQGLSEQREARKESLPARVSACAEIVNAQPDESWIVWCDLNDESSALAKAISSAVEVRGSMTDVQKELAIEWFAKECTCRQRKNEESTTENITSPTSIAGKNITEPEGQKRTQKDAVNTQQILDSELRKSKKSLTISSATQKCGSLSASENSESSQTTSEESLLRKMEVAPFAVASKAKTYDTSASMSIMTMQPEKSEDCFAPPVILGLESSKTIRDGSKEPPCICGKRGRKLISKPSILGWGLNWQHCARTAFVGLSHSFEAWYQAIRRTYRFGQKREVECYMISSDAEGSVVANLKRKQRSAEDMAQSMIAEMSEFTRSDLGKTKRDQTEYKPTVTMTIPAWIGKDEQ